MLSIIKSMSLHGLNGSLVSVEVDVSRRTPFMGYSSGYQILVSKNQKKELKQQLKIQE